MEFKMSQPGPRFPQPCDLTRQELCNNGRRDVSEECPKCGHFIYDHQTEQQQAQGKYHYYP